MKLEIRLFNPWPKGFVFFRTGNFTFWPHRVIKVGSHQRCDSNLLKGTITPLVNGGVQLMINELEDVESASP